MNCPKCDAEDFYLGISTKACNNDKCELYAAPGVSCPELLYVEGSGSTARDASPSVSHPSPGETKGEGPSGSLDDGGIKLAGIQRWWELLPSSRLTKTDQCLSLAGMSTKPMTPSTTLLEVNGRLSEAGKSQSHKLLRSLGPIRSPLKVLADCLTLATDATRPGVPDYMEIHNMLCALSALHARLPDLKDTLEQCDQFLHKLQSADPHPSGNRKSVDTCQTDTAHDLDSPAKSSRKYPVSRGLADDFDNPGPGSSVPKIHTQSCEKQSPERWQDYGDCTYLSDSQGFEKGLSLWSRQVGSSVSVFPLAWDSMYRTYEVQELPHQRAVIHEQESLSSLARKLEEAYEVLSKDS